MALLLVGGFGMAYADVSISVSQDNTPEEQEWLERVGNGEKITFTEGVGITIPSKNYTVVENMDWLIENGFLYTENRTVSLPHPVQEQKCTTQWTDFFTIQTTCSFVYEHVPAEENPLHLSTFTPNGCEVGYVRDITTHECKLPEVLEAEAKDLIEQTETVTPEGKWDRRLAELKAIENPTRTEKRIIELLENLNAVCVNDVLQIQSFREYDVSMEEFFDPVTGEWKSQLMTKKVMSAVSLDNFPALKAIRTAIQECIAENTLKSRILTASTFNKVVDDINTYNIYHADFARDKIATPQPVTTEELKESAKDRALLSICENDWYGNKMKIQMGCTNLEDYESLRDAPPIRDAFPLEIQKRVNQYNEDDGNAQYQEAVKQNIQKQIDRLTLKLRSQ